MAKSKVTSTDEQKDGRGTDLFVWLDALWTKRRPEGTPPVFMLHRFLAADKDLAPFCRALAQDIRDSTFIFLTWQALLPRGAGAPRLAYVAPKKPPAMEALIARMVTVLAARRSVVEEMVAIVKEAGKLPALYAEFGIESKGGT